MHKLSSIYRSHLCDQIRAADVGKEVTLSGWVHRKRDHGGVIFLDLRDNYGVTQVVFSGELKEEIQNIRLESVISVSGKVVTRSDETVNSKLETGEVEVHCELLKLLSSCEMLPFQIAEDDNAPEATRLKYRFLELRREQLHRNILLRNKVIFAMRKIMYDLGFFEFQTPILTSSSPEGARDYLVPSRHHPGKFFALPQAPQQFKQLLMVAGFDRYFQIAPCFRDEDPRADRSPGEFYQCDLEMSFVEQDDVFDTCEQLFYRTFSEFSDWHVSKPPFTRIKYKDALAKYGTDKPDLRIDLLIEDVSSAFQGTQFKVFANVLSQQQSIRAIKLELDQIPARKYFDDSIEYFKSISGMGLAYLIFDGEAPRGSVAKFFGEGEVNELRSLLKIDKQCLVFFAAGEDRQTLPALGRLRVKLAQDFGRIKENTYEFCWITDYPMYEQDPDTGKVDFSHNPFSMPQGGLEALANKDPLDIYAYQYDVVCNGHELSSGAIRNHLPDIMYKAFEIAGYNKDEVDSQFGGMIRAFKFGAPPHGGMAPGVDRIVMLLAGEQAIRDVIAFPLAQTVEDLLMGAPNTVDPRQLKELHLALKLPEEKLV